MLIGRSRRVAPGDASRATRVRPRGRATGPGRSAPASALAALAAVTSAVSLSAAAVAGPLAPSGAVAVLDLPAAMSAVAVAVAVGAGADDAPAGRADEPDGSAGAPAPTTATRYELREGDTLASAAVLHAVAPADLAAANRLRPPYAVRAGQVLEVPRRRDPAPLPGPIADHARRAELLPAFAAAAADHDVPPELLMAVAWQESRWKDGDVSEDGAVGIAQLLPSTADWVAATMLDGERLDLRRTDDNLRVSARYLRYLLDRTGGDEARALAAYYQGPASTGDGRWYDDTERYVHDVFALRWAFEGAVPSVP